MGRLIILAGPSCVGKGPLHTAFNNFYPEPAANLQKLVLYNCRSPRPGEIDGKDYYFTSREEIDGFQEKKISLSWMFAETFRQLICMMSSERWPPGIYSSRVIRSLVGNC